MTIDNPQRKRSSIKIYFAGSISGGRKYLDTYIMIVAYLKKLGHKVLSDHIVKPDVLNFETKFTDKQIFERDLEWIRECDIFIAEVVNVQVDDKYINEYVI